MAPAPPAPGRRLVALDVDGTLLRHDGVLSEAVRAAVADTAATGSHVVIATGRAVIGTMPILARLGITTGYAVCSNGAVTVRLDPRRRKGYQVLERVTFDPGPALALIRQSLPGARIAVEELGVGSMVDVPFPDGELSGRQRIVPWDELVSLPATRVSVRDPDSTPEAFLRAVESIGLHGVSYAVGYTAWLDLNPEGVSKASALEQLRRRLAVEPGDTIAVGDQRNDVEMLHWAARGVAMGNAPPEVQAVADEVTGHVLDDGVVPVLRSVIAGMPEPAPVRAFDRTFDRTSDRAFDRASVPTRRD